jgi:glycosyltransferase involved in cell wall biosynthesis
MYNAEKSIIRALDSVQKQEDHDFIKHYIYNDSSTDNSRDIVLKYFKEDDITPWELHGDCIRKGQSHARNYLIKQAIKDGCEYIAFLDADDEWMPDHLHISMINLASYDVSYSIPQLTDGLQNVVAYGIPVPKIFIGKHLENNNFIWISGVVACAECLKSFDFDSTLDSIEDWDMWYRLYKFGLSFKCTDIKTFKYFVGNDTSASKSGKKLELLRSKHDFKMKGLNLNLACGGDYQPEYINVDLYPTDPSKIDAQFDVKDIPYEDNTIDTIRAMHIIEHFSFKEGQKVLQE